jgi:gliding motility-associated-like protein
VKALKNILLFLFLSSSTAALGQEICDNAVDDDGDGLIDLNDLLDCNCFGIEEMSTPESIIPNHSFEEMDCCPSSVSQLNCASEWAQATNTSTDYYNLCDSFIYQIMDSILLFNIPDGNGFVGALYKDSWKEYVGCCLLQPLQPEISYTLKFNIATVGIGGQNVFEPIMGLSPVEVSIFGNPTCTSFPINTFDCPNDWILLGSVTYSPISSWQNISITFYSSLNINSIMLGPPCYLPNDYSEFPYTPYFIYDDLVLNKSSLFSSTTMTKSGGFCSNDLELNSSIDTFGGFWQWYRNGIALIGQTENILKISKNNLGNGSYSVVYTLNDQCSAAVNSTVASSEDFLFTIPNVFTPNDDNINDLFLPIFSSVNLPCWEINVYNLWGNLVYSKKVGEENSWDGKNNNGIYLDAGTYFYILKVNDVDIKHGTVTLIRD